MKPAVLFTKNEASKLLAKSLYLGGIIGIAEALSQFKEGLFLLLTGLKAQFQQFHENTIAAQTALPGNGLNSLIDFGWKRYAAPNLLLCWNVLYVTPFWCKKMINSVSPEGDINGNGVIQPTMKQPTDQRERNEDKKNPEQNPSRGIDPESNEKEMEVMDQDPGHRQKENQNQKKDDDLAA